jgi:hypothetical protein
MGNLWITLGVFLVGVALFHFVFIKLKMRPKAFWIRSDYIWLTLAGVSVILATASVRKTISEWRLPLMEGWVQAQFDHTVTSVTGERDYWCRMDEQTACEWYEDLDSVLDISHKTGEWREFLIEHQNDPQDHLSIVRSSTERAIRALSRLREMSDELQGIRQDTQSSAFETLLVLISPWTLALALALRFTKVTAQARLEQMAGDAESASGSDEARP